MRIWPEAIVAIVLAAAVFSGASSAPADLSATLVDAARDGALAKVEELISSGAPVNARDAVGRTALHYAAENGHIGTVKLLLEKGANVEITDNAWQEIFQKQFERINGKKLEDAALRWGALTGGANRAGPVRRRVQRIQTMASPACDLLSRHGTAACGRASPRQARR